MGFTDHLYHSLPIALGPAICAICAGLATPAFADEALPAKAAISVALEARAEAATPAQVFIARPVGTVSIGTDADDPGGARYASRPSGEGAVGVVRFTTVRPRIMAAPGVAASLPMGMPLARALITSRFGNRVNPVTGSAQRHSGLDLAAPTGAPVAATGGGTIRFAGPAGNYGLLVVVDHGSGLESRYAHLSRIAVRSGQAVAAGDLLGLVGSTGRSTGPHLHYELRANGHALDPLRR